MALIHAAIGLAAEKSQARLAEPLPTIFYPSLPQQPRLQFLTTINDARLATIKKGGFFKFVFGKEQAEDRPQAVVKPYGLAIHDGRLYICDAKAGLLCFDLKAHRTDRMGTTEPGKLGRPVNLDVDASGTLYVADNQRGQVVAYSATHAFLAAYGQPGDFKPADVLVRRNRLYVADTEKHQIVVLDPASGKILRRIGKRGSAPGELFYPTNLAADADGNLYVSETGNFRISVFTPDGRFIKSVGQIGRTPGSFARNKGLALDRERNLYVVDAAFENVQIFNAKGQLLMYFLGPGSGRGDINLPADLWIDYDNVDYFRVFADPKFKIQYLLFVSSQFGANKINVYGFGTYTR